MFCANAIGKLLSPMVEYQAKFVHDGLVSSDPKGGIFDGTEFGWVNGPTFKRRFQEVFVRNLAGDGPFAFIGDNLGSHFSEGVIQICLQMNIRLITLIPLPAIRFVSFWANEEKLKEPLKKKPFKGHTLKATFSATFEMHFK